MVEKGLRVKAFEDRKNVETPLTIGTYVRTKSRDKLCRTRTNWNVVAKRNFDASKREIVNAVFSTFTRLHLKKTYRIRNAHRYGEKTTHTVDEFLTCQMYYPGWYESEA